MLHYFEKHTARLSSFREIMVGWGDILVLTCLMAGFACIASTSLPLPNVGFAQDLGVFVDAGWRFFQGQRCHADYRSGLGPVFGMLAGIPFCLFGPEYGSLKLLPVSVSAILAFWALVLVRGIIPAPAALSVSLAIGLYAGGIFHPGFEPQGLTFAAFYNRVGFGLLAICCLAASMPVDSREGKTHHIRDISAGAALGIAAFLKVNFFLVGLLAVCSGAVLNNLSRQRCLLVAASSVCCAILFLPFIGFRIDRMVEDLTLAAALRQTVVSNLTFFPQRNFLQNLDYFIILVFQTLCLLPNLSLRGLVQTRAMFLTLWSPACMGFALTLMQSHGNGRCFPTIVVGMAAALPMLKSAYKNDSYPIRSRVFVAGLLIASALIIVPHTYAYAVLSALKPAHFPGRFDSYSLRDLKVGPYNNWGDHFTTLTNEAMGLVKKHCRRANTLQYIDLSNLYSFGLGLRSPKSAMLWWDDRATYSAAVHPGNEIFADTDFILIPYTAPLHPQPVWEDIYGQYITQHFYEIEKSANFKLLAKRDLGG